jgi:molecular chaperone GrpE
MDDRQRPERDAPEPDVSEHEEPELAGPGAFESADPDPAPDDAAPDDAAPDAEAAGADAEVALEAIDSTEEAIDSLREELDVARDRALRVQAELENYRKRVARERADEHRYANLPLLRDLLPVVDNLERAIAAAEQTHDAGTLLDGVKLVKEQLAGVLAKHDCVPIEAQGEPFDPHRHEAVLQQPSDEVPANAVLQVTQTGYRLHDRVVRAAQVVVSAGPENQGEDENS